MRVDSGASAYFEQEPTFGVMFEIYIRPFRNFRIKRETSTATHIFRLSDHPQLPDRAEPRSNKMIKQKQSLFGSTQHLKKGLSIIYLPFSFFLTLCCNYTTCRIAEIILKYLFQLNTFSGSLLDVLYRKLTYYMLTFFFSPSLSF